MQIAKHILLSLSFLNFLIIGLGGLELVDVSATNSNQSGISCQTNCCPNQIYVRDNQSQSNSDLLQLNLKEPDDNNSSKTLLSSSSVKILVDHTLFTSKISKIFKYISKSKYLLNQSFRL